MADRLPQRGIPGDSQSEEPYTALPEPREFREPRWLVCLDDINRLRRWAFKHHLADSAMAVHRLLDIAEAHDENLA